MEWINLSTKEEFKQYASGKYKKFQLVNLKKEINNDLIKLAESVDENCKGSNEMIKIKAGSWDALAKKVKVLKGICIEVGCGNNKSEYVETLDEGYKGMYFKSEGDEVIFYMLELSGKKRNEKLGVKEEYYKDIELAKKWRKEILKKIHPDVCKNPNASKALIEFQQLYEGIIQ
ncbi:MAG: hypothetical protein ACRC7N_17575 [Clostridium sp.]